MSEKVGWLKKGLALLGTCLMVYLVFWRFNLYDQIIIWMTAGLLDASSPGSILTLIGGLIGLFFSSLLTIATLGFIAAGTIFGLSYISAGAGLTRRPLRVSDFDNQEPSL